jgi:alkylation response protein AidB-like acyl-CoA dehydrogenase
MVDADVGMSMATYVEGLVRFLEGDQFVADKVDEPLFEQRLDFERRLYLSEWFGVWLPEEAGGKGWPTSFRIEFERTLAGIGLEDRICRIGQNLFLPTLLEYGSSAMKSRFVRPTAKGEILWCQGFSEPMAGSDLASLRTKAQTSADGMYVTGQKIWTSLAHVADFCFCLVRTDDSVDAHAGITMIVIDMKSPGIDVRRIRQIDGNREFSEVFLDNVFVPAENVVGSVNDGWHVAMNTLRFERSLANIGRQARFGVQLHRLVKMVSQADELPRDQAMLDFLGLCVIDSHVMTCAAESIAVLDEDADSLPLEGSIAKLHWSEAHQRMTKWALDQATLLWRAARIDGSEYDYWRTNYLSSFAETIYAGTSEIQRNIIARRGIGLPK